MPDIAKRRRFLLFLVKPSHYDDQGYVIQWWKSALPSNSLACLFGIAQKCMEEQVLGEDVDIEIFPVDETNTRVRPDRIIRQIKDNGGFGMVGFVGVQSNQYPRVLDCARPMRAAGVQVCIGGFHVSGCLSMLPERPQSLNEALDLGISLYAGEAEGRFDEVLARRRRRQAEADLQLSPRSSGAGRGDTAIHAARAGGRTLGMISSFDAGRGCPFLCSFCTIINVQGRKSRYRTADDIEALVRVNVANGVRYFFITDDNLARNRNWESIFDRLPRCARKASTRASSSRSTRRATRFPASSRRRWRRASSGCSSGLRTSIPTTFAAAKKKQNHISDYRELLLEWRKHRCITYCGYIIGFPNDTPELLVKRIQIIQRELPLDILEFSILTPLPGSEDHAKAVAKGVDIDPDLNKFDLEHVTTDHPRMSREEWQEAYRLAWRTYYTQDHIKTVIRRAVAGGPRPDTVAYLLTWFWASFHFYNIYPLETGMIRRRYRRDRRPGLPLENPLLFYARNWGGQVVTYGRILAMFAKIHLWTRRLERDPNAKNYTDEALRTTRRLRSPGNVPALRIGAKGGRIKPSASRSTSTRRSGRTGRVGDACDGGGIGGGRRLNAHKADALADSSRRRRGRHFRREPRWNGASVGRAGGCADRIQGLGRGHGRPRHPASGACPRPSRIHRLLGVHHPAGRSLFAWAHRGRGRSCA